MIVRSLSELESTDRVVSAPGWTSHRLLLKEDGMGFSLHETEITAGANLEMQYSNHLEAVYCIEGEGSVLALKTGEEFPLQVGTVYALNENDRHILSARTKMRMVCVFNPPLVGPESHDESGAYPALATATE